MSAQRNFLVDCVEEGVPEHALAHYDSRLVSARVCLCKYCGKDWKEAFSRYLTFVRAGGTKDYVELVTLADLELPFHDGCIKKLCAEINEFLASHQAAEPAACLKQNRDEP